MKIIDLIIDIANKNELPNKIKYQGYIYEYDTNHQRYESYFDEQIWTLNDFVDVNEVDILNAEIEVIEEKKIPEKLHLYEETQNIIRENNYKLVYHDIHKCIVSLECKYNQLIDYLQSKGE